MAIEKKYWICPRGCISVIDWDRSQSPPIAICRACGTKSTDGVEYKKKFFAHPEQYDKDCSELENQKKAESSVDHSSADNSNPVLNFSPRRMNCPRTTY